jgi:hypothetical protein
MRVWAVLGGYRRREKGMWSLRGDRELGWFCEVCELRGLWTQFQNRCLTRLEGIVELSYQALGVSHSEISWCAR